MKKHTTEQKPAKASRTSNPSCPAKADRIQGGGNWAWAYYAQPDAEAKAQAVTQWMKEGGNWKWSCGGRADCSLAADGQTWVVHYHLDNDRRPSA